MTIERLGSIGEVIGTLATVATRLYLAIRTRANTVVVKAEANRAAQSYVSQVNLALVQDRQVARVLRRGLVDPESLEPNERDRFIFLMTEYASVSDAAFAWKRDGTDDAESLDKSFAGLRRFLRSSGGRADRRACGARSWSAEFRSFAEFEVFTDGDVTDPSSDDGAV